MSDTKVFGITAPRIFTPPLRELTEETTNGYAVIAFAETMLGMSLFPWQKWLLIHALELSEDGTYRFRVVVVELARQNGKTMVEIILALWHLYVAKSRKIIGTAQSLEKAEDAWKEAVAMAQSDDELGELIPPDGVFLGHPKHFVVLHEDAQCEYRIAAASRKGARGFSADLILLDELREHQNWDSWASVTNTMNARPQAQSFAFSNAGTIESVVLRYQRALAHKNLGWPDGDEDVQNEILMDVVDTTQLEEMEDDFEDESPYETGYFEWSMPPGCPRNNPEGLAQANPSMNHTDVTRNCITLRALWHGVYNSPAEVVETEICCRWPTMGTGGPFVEGSWEDTMDAHASPVVGSSSVVCVEISSKRSQTYIVRAATDDDGKAIVGVWADRAGTDWVMDWLAEHRDSIDALIVRAVTGAPIMSLYDDMVSAELPVVDWKGADVSAATGQMFDRLRDNDIRHLPHGGMDMAATSAVAALQPQGGWVVDIKKSPTDTAPLIGAIGAAWGLEHVPDTVSMYAKDDVMVIGGRK